MRQLGTRLKKLKFGKGGEVLLMELFGFINAATFIEFEKHIKALLDKKVTNLAIDFGGVEYINSSGMGMLMAVHDALAPIGGRICLLNVPGNVAQTMKMLGVPQVVPFLPDREAMVRYFSGAAAVARPKAPVRVASAAHAIAARTDGRGPISPVIVLSPAANHFTDLIRLRFGKSAGHFHVLTDCHEAWNRFAQIGPDLVILEDALPGSDEFLGKVKTDREKCHVSVIKVYNKAVDPRTKVAFKIWENDYLQEPFELKELFALAAAELMRVPGDRRALVQQVHFTFAYSEDNLNRALGIGKSAIFSGQLTEDKAVPLYAAFQESVDNALRHGNRYDQRKRVDITLLVAPDEIQITVEDEGKGFDYEKYLKLATDLDAVARTRLAREEGKIGGLGIKLMMECADRVEYFEKGRRIRLSKKIGAAAAAKARAATAAR